eukprot:22223_1
MSSQIAIHDRRISKSLDFQDLKSIDKVKSSHRRTLSSSLYETGKDKKDICAGCQKRAYPTERVVVDSLCYHKRCFKCSHCKTRLTMGGFAMINGHSYCKPHFKQLFQSSGGKYDRAFGSVFTNSSDPLAKVVQRKSQSMGSFPPVQPLAKVSEQPEQPQVKVVVRRSSTRSNSGKNVVELNNEAGALKLVQNSDSNDQWH